MPVPKVCRLCMSKDNLVSMFVNNSFNSDDIFQASGVQVEANDGLPQKICTKCLQDLKHILDFREKCRDTENQLICWNKRSESETNSCDSTIDINDIKKEPLDKVDGEVRSGINIEFEKTDSENEDNVTSKEFNKQIVCKFCRRHIFKRRLKLHLAQRHPEWDKSKDKCDLCIEYVNKLYMSKHLLLIHKDFICIYCKTNCYTREGLMKHLETCSDTCRRPVSYTRELVPCNFCHIFLTRSQLYKHKRTEHSNQPGVYQRHPYDQKVICDICELKFFTIQALNKHKQKHYTNEHFEITSIDNATPLKTKNDILDRVRHIGPKKYRVPKIGGVNKVLIKSLLCYPAGENFLLEWLIEMQDRQFVLDKTSIFNSIEKIIGDQRVPLSHIISWINNFLDKHLDIEVRETKKLEEVYTEIDVQVKKWFENVKEYLVKKKLWELMDDHNRVFSSDERLFFTTTYENKYRLVQYKSHNVLFTANAAGVLAPPMIVFAYKEVPKEVMENIPDKWAVRRSDNGITSCDNFYEYIKDVFNPWLEEAGIKKPVILFLNAYTSFLTFQLCDFCFQNGVELVALYPYSNGITPMELALFKPMNNLWKKAISKDEGGFPEVKNLAPLLRDVVSKIPIDAIKQGFLKAGLFPMDFNNIDIPKQATVKRYDYFRNTGNFPRNETNESSLVNSETQEIDSPKLGKVCKVYLSKKQLLEKKEREEKEVKIKEEVNEESESNEIDEVQNSNKERKAIKRKTKEKLKFESSEESE